MFDLLFEKSGLSLERLRNFCRVAESESFTQAAEGDPNRQTLYSRQVKELETYFETELFRRKGRTVVLTETGKSLFLLAMEYFSALEDFTESCSSELRSYSIGAGDSLIQWRILPSLPKIHQFTGKSEIAFKNMRTDAIVAGLLSGEIDFGLIREEALVPDLVSKNAGVLEYSLITTSESVQSLKKNADYLSELTFVGMIGGGLYQKQMESLAKSSKTIIRYAMRCNSYPTMLKAVKELGIAAILPTIALKELPQDRFTAIRLEQLKPFTRSLSLCWNRRLATMNPALENLGEKIAKILT